MRLAPIPKVTMLTRAEWTSIKARRWDYVPKAERMAALRGRLERMRMERQERATQGA